MGMVTNSFNSASSLLSNMDKPAFMMEMASKGSLDARSQLAELAGHLGDHMLQTMLVSSGSSA